MQNIPLLLPAPRDIKLIEGLCDLSHRSLILLDAKSPQDIVFSALRVQTALEEYYQLQLQLYAGKTARPGQVGIRLRLDPTLNVIKQGYTLKIDPGGILIASQEEAGLFYACCTLIQIIQYYAAEHEPAQYVPSGHLPCMQIIDWPDFPNRGVMLDISRDKVPTMGTLYELVDLLASWKINQLQLYTEHTFAYQQHPEVWAGASPITGEEILSIGSIL